MLGRGKSRPVLPPSPKSHPMWPAEQERRDGQPCISLLLAGCREQERGCGGAGLGAAGAARPGADEPPPPHKPVPRQPNYINPEDKLQSVYVLPLLWFAMLGRQLQLTASFSLVYFLNKLKGLETAFLSKYVCISSYVRLQAHTHIYKTL